MRCEAEREMQAEIVWLVSGEWSGVHRGTGSSWSWRLLHCCRIAVTINILVASACLHLSLGHSLSARSLSLLQSYFSLLSPHVLLLCPVAVEILH